MSPSDHAPDHRTSIIDAGFAISLVNVVRHRLGIVAAIPSMYSKDLRGEFPSH